MKGTHCLLLSCILTLFSCGGESNSGASQSSSSRQITATSESDTFVSALSSQGYSFVDSQAPGRAYELLAPKIRAYFSSKENLADSVQQDSGELFKKMKDIDVSDETANTLLGAMKGDGSTYFDTRDAQDSLLLAFQSAVDEMSKSEKLSDYEAKKILKRAVVKTWPKIRWRINSQPKLSGLSYSPALPAEDPEYVSLLNAETFYWEAKYADLLRTEREDLPKGAIVPLLKLISKPIPQGDLREGAEYPHKILSKYGEAVCDPVTKLLLEPEQFGISSGFSRPPYHELALLAECPEEKRREIMKASLESGWTNVGQYIPANEEWADQLYDRFEDSPYGKAGRFEQFRIPTVEEQQLLDQQFAKFKLLFDEKVAGSESVNIYGIMLDLEKQFKFESEKLNREFNKRIHAYHDNLTKSL